LKNARRNRVGPGFEVPTAVIGECNNIEIAPIFPNEICHHVSSGTDANGEVNGEIRRELKRHECSVGDNATEPSLLCTPEALPNRRVNSVGTDDEVEVLLVTLGKVHSRLLADLGNRGHLGIEDEVDIAAGGMEDLDDVRAVHAEEWCSPTILCDFPEWRSRNLAVIFPSTKHRALGSGADGAQASIKPETEKHPCSIGAQLNARSDFSERI
jgi:hypothetical protein